MTSKIFYHFTALWKSLMSNFLPTEIERLISCYLLHRFSFGEWILNPSKPHSSGRGFSLLQQTRWWCPSWCSAAWAGLMRADMGNISWRETVQTVSLSCSTFNRLSQNLRLQKWRHLWTLWRQQSDTVQPGWAANLKLSMACFSRHPSGRPLAFGLLSCSSCIHSGCLERVW